MVRVFAPLALVLLATTAVAGSLTLPDTTSHLSGLTVTAVEVPLVHEEVLIDALAGRTETVVVTVVSGRLAGVLDALETLGLEHHAFDELSMVAVRLPAPAVDAVAALDGVTGVWPNEAMRPTLDRSAAYVGADILRATYLVSGSSTARVLVVDSGVDGSHSDLKYGRVLVENVVTTPRGVGGLIGGYQEGVQASDTDGHGTHVASIVAGRAEASPEGRYLGLAPGTQIIGFQAGITDTNGDVRFESVTVLEAFNYALKKKDALDIRVVNNAWGTNGDFDPDNPINQATFRLYKAGLVVTFAAGNEAETGPGNLNKYCVAPWVLCVTAGDYLNHRASFASIGTDPAVSGLAYDHPDLAAPGVAIMAARPVVKQEAPAYGMSGAPVYYVSKSGTSMATPHVSAVAAILMGDNPNLSPDDVHDILTTSATRIPGSPVWETGAGYLNALDAYRLAEDVEGSRGQFMDGHVKYGGKATGDPEHARDAVTVGLGFGKATRATAADTPPQEFFEELATTPMGLSFLIGSLVMAASSFAIRRKATP